MVGLEGRKPAPIGILARDVASCNDGAMSEEPSTTHEPSDGSKGAGVTKAAEPTARRKLRSFVPAPLRHGLVLFLLLLLIEYVIIPSFLSSKEAGVLTQLGRVNVIWLVAGFLLEAAALVAYARLTLAVLPHGSLGLSKVLRIDLSTLAVSHVLPGGTAGGTGLGYRLLTANGISGTDAGFAMASQGIGSAIVLNVMLWIALVVSIPLHGFNKAYVTVALVGAVLLAAIGLLVLALTRGEQRATRALRAVGRRLPRVSEAQVDALVQRVGERLRSLGSDRRQLRLAISWAAANWLFDAASLWAFVIAFRGHFTSPIDLFVAYGVANVVAAVPLTPGGLGLVEAVAASSLIGFGVPAADAWLGVISWRLFNFWLPIPVGAGSYLSLRVRRGAGLRERRTALGDMTAHD